MTDKDLRKFIALEIKRTMLSSTDDIVEDDENLDEFSGGGVPGFSLPLFYSPEISNRVAKIPYGRHGGSVKKRRKQKKNRS